MENTILTTLYFGGKCLTLQHIFRHFFLFPPLHISVEVAEEGSKRALNTSSRKRKEEDRSRHLSTYNVMKNLFDPKKEGKERVWGKVTKPRTVNTGEIDERRWNPIKIGQSCKNSKKKQSKKFFPLFLKKVDSKCGRWKEHLSQRFFPLSFPENVFLSPRRVLLLLLLLLDPSISLAIFQKEERRGLRWGSGGEGVLKSKKKPYCICPFLRPYSSLPLFTVGFIAWVSKNSFLPLLLLFLLYPVHILPAHLSARTHFLHCTFFC